MRGTDAKFAEPLFDPASPAIRELTCGYLFLFMISKPRLSGLFTS